MTNNTAVGYSISRGRFIYYTGEKNIMVKRSNKFTKTFIKLFSNALKGIIPKHPKVKELSDAWYKQKIYNLATGRWLNKRTVLTLKGQVRSRYSKRFQLDTLYPTLRVVPVIGKTLDRIVVKLNEIKKLANAHMYILKNNIKRMIDGDDNYLLKLSFKIKKIIDDEFIEKSTNDFFETSKIYVPKIFTTQKDKGNWILESLGDFWYSQVADMKNKLESRGIKLEGDTLANSFFVIEKLTNIRNLKSDDEMLFDIGDESKQQTSKLTNLNQLFMIGEKNCVIKCIREQLNDNYEKEYSKVLDYLDDKYKNGVRYDDLEYIAKKLKLNIVVEDINKTIKYQTKERKKRKVIHLVNSEYNHVETFKHSLFSALYKKEQEIKDYDYIEGMYEDKNHEYYKTSKYIKKEGECVVLNDKIIMTEEYKRNNDQIRDFFNKSFTPNEYISSQNIDKFNFIKSSIHHAGIYLNNGNILNLDEIVALDKNKAYASTHLNFYYDKFKYPSGMEGIYKNNDKISSKYIIEKNGISSVYNINVDGCTDIIKSYQRKIKFIKEGSKYPNHYLHYLYNELNVKFDIDYCCLSHRKRDLIFTEEEIKSGIYKKLYGVFQMGLKPSIYNIHASQDTIKVMIDDIKKDPDFGLYPCEYDNTDGKNSEKNIKLVISKKKEWCQNLSYISSYMVGYTLIETLDKLKNIPIHYVKRLSCDCITTSKKYTNLFKIDKDDISAWKYEEVKYDDFNSENFLSECNYKINYDNCYGLTMNKLRYEKYNLITGAAGTGKSSRNYEKFDKDERLDDTLFLYPSLDLCQDFKQKYPNIKAITYQKFIVNGFEENKDFRKIARCKNIMVDECTFISKEDFDKIIERANKFRFNLFFIGDLDEKRAYQLKPPEGEFTTLQDYKNIGVYHLKLTKVHRNGGELLDRLNKIRKENLDNKQCIDLFKDRFIKRKDIISKYGDVSLDKIVLAPTNKWVASFNNYLYKNNDIVIQKDPKTNYCKKEINNKRRIKTKETFEYDNMLTDVKSINNHLGYSITAHLSQGKTYKDKVFIVPEGLYTENLLYVMLSRATSLDKIFILT